MQVNDELISALEKLARLQLSTEERERLGQDLQHILDLVDRLKELDTDGVEPLIWLSDPEQTLREDQVSNQLTPAEALQNAPSHDQHFFRVPKVID